MPNLQLYSILVGVLNGVLLAQEQEIDWTRTSASQPVDTVLGGYSGESPGSPMLELDINNAAPQGGFEFDAGPYIASLTIVAVQVIGPGGKVMKGDGFIIQDNGRHGVNQQMRYNFRIRMPIKQFK